MNRRALAALVILAAPVWTQAPPKSAQPPEPEPTRFPPGFYAVINTSVGPITAQLFEKETPNTVRNFVGLARGTQPWLDAKGRRVDKKPLYANIIFHRVIPQFMIQTGDPTGVGNHNCGYTIKAEFVEGLKFDRPGRLGMATFAGEPDSGACQFFITEVADATLDGKHTIFGQVVDGLDLVSKISRVIRDENDKPRIPTRLIGITFLRVAGDAAPANAPMKIGDSPSQR
jgi:cyclophilin family peptidyl-prolyl cis-trans isomerase